MVVNSLIFWFFFIIVLLPYYTLFCNSKKYQNLWLLIVSCFYFGYAELKMLPVIILSTLVFYVFGILIERYRNKKPNIATTITTCGVCLGTGILIYFKYLNFLVNQMSLLLTSLGLHASIDSLNIVMLLGVSYFTFKLIAYLIDINLGKIDASHDIVAFGLFVSFFPTLLAGPIDRAQNFLPQLECSRKINYDNIIEGLTRILWGLFLKTCIADRLSTFVAAVYENYSYYSSLSIVFAAVFYFFQSYTDFCGYSHMAVGVGRIMGLKVSENFNRPLMGQNIAEMWRRWHISLTSWMTDYVFKPLTVQFRGIGNWGLYLATMINMIIVGSWHGANWTYVVFGVYHGLLVIAVAALEKSRKRFEKRHSLKGRWYYAWPRRLITWSFFIIGTTLFRSDSCSHFLNIISMLFNNDTHTNWNILFSPIVLGIPAIVVMLFKEFKDENKYNYHFLHSDNALIKILSFATLIVWIVFFGELNGGEFIYFQF